jgi:hypothetical protein
MGTGDIVIHIDEDLNDDRIHQLEREISDVDGVVSVCMHENARHLLVVDFDPETVKPSNIVHSFRGKGLHAQMIGL